MKKIFISLLSLVSLVTLVGRSQSQGGEQSEKEKSKVTLVLGSGGADGRSFNQAGWEGLEAWGKEEKLIAKKDFTYIETNNPEDNSTNIDQAIRNGSTAIISLSYLQTEELENAARDNPRLKFTLVDGEITGKKDTSSATFKDQESAYLAGLTAAYTAKSDQVGFVGGMEGPVIQRFQSGFEAGAKAGAITLNREITVNVQYAASYDSLDKGKVIAASMYKEGVDILYQATGSTGAGVFQEAKARNESDYSRKVWVISIDRDQADEGDYKMENGETGNFTSTSTKKNVSAEVKEFTETSHNDKFPGGKHLTLGLKEEGVDLTKGQLSGEAYQAVSDAKEKIISSDFRL